MLSNPGNRLEEIFDHQEALMEKFHPIERANGFFRPDHHVIDLDDPRVQDRLRGLAWNTIEEYGEAIDEPGPPSKQLEELADTLHFLVELMIASGLRPHHFGDPRQDQLIELSLRGVEQNWPSLSPRDLPVLQLSFVACLAGAMNALKNRPWKQTRRPTDIPVYFSRLKVALVEFLTVVTYMGHSASDLHRAYCHKNQENHLRIQGGV